MTSQSRRFTRALFAPLFIAGAIAMGSATASATQCSRPMAGACLVPAVSGSGIGERDEGVARELVATYGEAVGLYFAGEYPSASRKLTQLIAAVPRWPDPFYWRGMVHAATGEHDEAISDFTHAIELGTDKAQVWVQRAAARIELGEFDSALDDCDAALAMAPDLASCYALRAGAYWLLDDPEASLANLETYTALSPYDAQARVFHGRVLDRLGRRDEALDAYADAISLNANATEPYLRRGWLHYDAGRMRDARADFERILEIEPANDLALDGLAWVYRSEGKLEQAVETFEAASAAAPERGVHYSSRAAVLALLGRRDDARAAYARAIELDPRNGEIYNSRALNLYMSAAEWDAAFTDISRAVEISPDVPAYQHTLGDWYFRTGDRAQAERVWRHTCEIASPGDVGEWQMELSRLGHFDGTIDFTCDSRMIEAFRSCARAGCSF